MDFGKRDEALQKKVLDALWKRHLINVNKEIGTAYFQAEVGDKIHPSVTLNREEIRKETGRVKIRAVVIDDYEQALRRPGFDVFRANIDTLLICMAPIRTSKNEFGSLAELEKQNETDLTENPQLADPPY